MIQIKCFEFNHFPVNTYILWDKESKEAAVIDCGCIYEKEEKMLDDYITQNQLSVKYLLNTHLHLDHAFGNSYFYKKYGIKVATHRADVEQLPSVVKQGQRYGITIPDLGYEIEDFLSDGDCIPLGASELKVIHISGHSPGGILFHSPADGFLISGDVLFHESVGRSDLWGGNEQQLIQGICEKLLILPDETVVYPGHGPATTIGHEKRYNPFL